MFTVFPRQWGGICLEGGYAGPQKHVKRVSWLGTVRTYCIYGVKNMKNQKKGR